MPSSSFWNVVATDGDSQFIVKYSEGQPYYLWNSSTQTLTLLAPAYATLVQPVWDPVGERFLFIGNSGTGSGLSSICSLVGPTITELVIPPVPNADYLLSSLFLDNNILYFYCAYNGGSNNNNLMAGTYDLASGECVVSVVDTVGISFNVSGPGWISAGVVSWLARPWLLTWTISSNTWTYVDVESQLEFASGETGVEATVYSTSPGWQWILNLNGNGIVGYNIQTGQFYGPAGIGINGSTTVTGNLGITGFLNPAYTQPAVTTPVSGTVYQNTTGGTLELTVGVDFTVAGTVQWALGDTSAPPAFGPAESGAVGTLCTRIRIPSGWYYSLTITGTATIGAPSVLVS
jgi:hypothetical protein